MILCFDLDNTLLKTKGSDYAHAEPIKERIKMVNEFYEANTIIISTGRGERWKDLTKLQLLQFGIKYHVLDIGNKPPADKYIDDKGINADDFFKG